ncbi:50S ribosomal protein L11 methyltransferase [Prochlorococcus marinus XMU1414]|uniref:Ribosomal protein L11 methyltransferase n=1 Tax=Prochlorococcus marinus XMU1424 TaxID=2774497 RepID=A0A9D9BXR0_PROMR|nr:50S ribosomal protein L11 methyltransferase [Prochlorococcus marinus]MBO8228780.1 50S ribosomal protein L11 methyltransferase [Prochlorococcus marinus XMU1414]MBW3046260.1 50S ribosomal protein L11 methyltransferase [Prochlorococcus marinus str. MU1414]MCR8531450.1 50S ribosomal protein L11 methyltransferase [Prochlorococcus marinus XMU1420]MCR8535178.1 50S ribosomal protein L11 methyltransferase [Prochlorococcus marinus XMU1424]
MAIKDWYKLTFLIESDSEEIIIWKLNELGIFSFSFEYLIKNENKKEVNIWLPVDDWGESSRSDFEKIISKLLNINAPKNQFFDWSIIKEEDWLTSWKKYWAPELVGNHFLILPCWMNVNEKFKDKKIIRIDPGAAFGTGSHPSTYLCLEKMENIFFSDKKILDIGSGSGILSVAARLLGAKEVYAVDNDYLAINSTKSNFQLNFGDLKNLNAYLGSFNEVILKNQLTQFDFVLCNILAEVIKGMIPNIYKCLRKNGEVIFSGILNSQKDEIIKILIQNDLKLLDVSTRKDWACISAQKASNQTKV